MAIGSLAIGASLTGLGLMACSSSHELADPAPRDDAGPVDEGGAVDAGGEPPIEDAGIDRRRPDGGEQEPEPATLHDLWAGTEMSCARVEKAGTTTTWCWGNNRFGQLGRGEVSSKNGETFTAQPVQSPIAPRIKSVTSGGPTCAIVDDRSLRCWGRGYVFGSPTLSTPPESALLDNVAEVQAGQSTACARLTDGQVACWGSNSSGQLGLGTSDWSSHATPEAIPGFTAEQISVGGSHVCALEDGEVWCWGSNSDGAVGGGVPRYSNSLVPAKVPGVGGIVRVAAGSGFTCALASDKTVWCWGDIPQASANWEPRPVHMLEVGFDEDDPEADRLLTDVEELAAGRSLCARRANGTVACIGTNGDMVGYPDVDHFRQTRRFTTVLGIGDARRIVAGFDHVCALTETGIVRCWGNNAQGQLGIDPLIKNRSGLPVRVSF